MVGMPDSLDPGLGVCAVLSAVECLHDAAISGAELQQAMRRVPGREFNHRVHLYQDFGAIIRGKRGAGTRSGMVALENGCGTGGCNGSLYDRRWSRGGDLYRH